MANIYESHADDPLRDDVPGFLARRTQIGRRAGSRRLGASVWEVPPGEAAYPYHYHLGEEELLLVLEGTGSLRTPAGWRPLARGEALAFLPGEPGAHQLLNDGDVPLVFLAVSTHGAPDIVVYPDSGKLSAAERLPEGGGLREIFVRSDQVGYWHGETPPRRPG